MQEFAQFIRKERMRLGYRIVDVADGAGCSRSLISLIEQGKRAPTVKAATMILESIHITDYTVYTKGRYKTISIPSRSLIFTIEHSKTHEARIRELEKRVFELEKLLVKR